MTTVIPTEIGRSAVRTGNRASVAATKLSPGLSRLVNQARKGYHQLETGAYLGNVGLVVAVAATGKTGSPPLTKINREHTMEPQPSPVNLLGETAKLVERFKLPGLNAAAVIEARRKDIEALADANRIALAGVQGVVQKHGDIL